MYVCVTCTGGTCGLAPSLPNRVTAEVTDFRGQRKAVKDADSGLDSTQDQESGCEFKLDYTCDGVHHTGWEHATSSGDWKIRFRQA